MICWEDFWRTLSLVGFFPPASNGDQNKNSHSPLVFWWYLLSSTSDHYGTTHPTQPNPFYWAYWTSKPGRYRRADRVVRQHACGNKASSSAEGGVVFFGKQVGRRLTAGTWSHIDGLVQMTFRNSRAVFSGSSRSSSGYKKGCFELSIRGDSTGRSLSYMCLQICFFWKQTTCLFPPQQNEILI